MASRKWDAYRTLGITDRDSPGTTCSGTNRHGKRCRWDIEHRDYEEIVGILNTMELKPPNKAHELLNELAKLSLCNDFHQGQTFEVVSRWKTSIYAAKEGYDEVLNLRKKIRLLEAQVDSKNVTELEAECKRITSLLVRHQAELVFFTEKLDGALQNAEYNRQQADTYQRASLNAKNTVKMLQHENAALLQRQQQLQSSSATLAQTLVEERPKLLKTTAERDSLRKVVAALECYVDNLSRQIGKEQQSSVIIHADLERSKDCISRLKSENTQHIKDLEAAKTELGLEKERSAKTQHDLKITNGILSITNSTLATTQIEIALLHTAFAELQVSSVEGRRNAAASMAALVKQIHAMKSHPFRTLYRSVSSAFTGWWRRTFSAIWSAVRVGTLRQ